jgi:hypothetical protein
LATPHDDERFVTLPQYPPKTVAAQLAIWPVQPTKKARPKPRLLRFQVEISGRIE